MTAIDEEVTRRARELYGSDDNAQRLFDWLAEREKGASHTSIATLIRQLDVNRGTAVSLSRKLEEIGAGRFVLGRNGYRSRFKWAYSCISLGKAAAGETDDIEEVEDEVEDDPIDAAVEEDRPAGGLTIQEAKVQLAAALGLVPDQIEIRITA